MASQAEPQIPRGCRTISVTLLDRPGMARTLKEDLEERYGAWFKFDYLVLNGVDDGAALWIQHHEARKEKALEVLRRC